MHQSEEEVPARHNRRAHGADGKVYINGVTKRQASKEIRKLRLSATA
jgi:hypothetical protein